MATSRCDECLGVHVSISLLQGRHCQLGHAPSRRQSVSLQLSSTTFLADSLPGPCVVRSQLACIRCGGTSCGGLAVACVITPLNSLC